ncbi:DinB family protein [Virgibacillus sp. MG-45]|uniref:DinB family protein n=1 Tax=Virgibacillus sp. MG-45 TaxID=3102791 RepID=UPI002EDB1F94
MLQPLFTYNWQVREEWYALLAQLPEKELFKKRTGGVGTIMHTLIHISDVEYSWVRAIQGKEDIPLKQEQYTSLQDAKQLADHYREQVEAFLFSDEFAAINQPIYASWLDDSFSKEEILHHIIAHEIHHIGQLSVWARELGIKPVSANFIYRNIR